MKTTLSLLAGAAFVFAGAAAQAQDFPNKPVTLVVPFAAGGPTDTVARLVGQSMSTALKQQVIVENVGGAGGTLGAGRVARSAPDGYTVLLHHIGHATSATLYRKLPYDTINDFAPVGLVTDGRWWGLVCARPGAMAASGVVDALTWSEERDVRDAFLTLLQLQRLFGGEPDDRLPAIPKVKNGKRVALVGAGPASLTVCNDLMPLGYECVIYEKLDRPGGLMRTNIPSFRLPAEVLDQEVDMILDMGVEVHYGTPVTSMGWLLDQGYDAVFIGSGAPKGKELDIPGRQEGAANIHIGIEWLESVHFGHTDRIGERVLVIGVGNTAMDCCRTSKRLGGTDVKVMARRERPYFKASPWELEDAEEEQVEILVNHAPASFVVEDGRLTGMMFDLLEWYDDKGRQKSRKVGEKFLPADDVILAIGQETAFP